MSFFRRRKADGDDHELTLRPVRSVVEVQAEAERLEERAARRRKAKVKRSRSKFFASSRPSLSVPDTPPSVIITPPTTVTEVPPTLPVPVEAAAPLPAAADSGQRRRVFLNQSLPRDELDDKGEPQIRYVRNKVRTTRYTPLTFLPKNLFEQFSRVANIYFVAVVGLTISPVFGGPSAILSIIPIGVILTSTAIKDAIEDARRSRSDDEVNNAPTTQLGGLWRNVNQPRDSRTWLERTFGLNKPGGVTRGVKKLRQRERDMPPLPLHRPGSALEETLGPRATVDASVQSHASLPLPNESSSPLFPTAQFARVSTEPESGAQWQRILWKKLGVGDIVLLREGDQVPADLLILATSDSDGLCFVETKNLDGETNLKPRRAVRATHQLSHEDDFARIQALFDTDAPHQNLYVQNGRFMHGPGGSEIEATSINEFILRGCTLRNTAWVVGLVAFTGSDTKIVLNGGDTPTKRSRIENETHFNVVMSFIILVGMCLFTAIASGATLSRDTNSQHYFYEDEALESSNKVVTSILTFGSALIVFQNMVPIGLYISLEIVRIIQAYLIGQDLDMWYEPLKTACVPKTLNISDDLGQIEYIFSDKTGTLTQNVMEFQRCSVNGVPYGDGVTEAERGAAKRRAEEGFERPTDYDPEQLEAARRKMIDVMKLGWSNRYLREDKLTMVAPRLAQELADPNHPQRQHIIAFFRAIALCHAVLVERVETEGDNESLSGHADGPIALEYKSESPDEVALVAAARDAGFPVIARTSKAIDIEILGRPERHVPLRALEFSSARKRMSVIARAPDGRIVLTCKGADSVVYARLAADHPPQLRADTQRDMELFATGGLRTLCVAHRVLSEEQFNTWAAKYDAAVNSTATAEQREQLIEAASDEIERDLYILGATALEDKLQEGVPETIATLHKAGIKLWILTGDKVQTAIEIGFSCNLLRNDMDVMVLSATSAAEARQLIDSSLEKVLPGSTQATLANEKPGFFRRSKSSVSTLTDVTPREPTGKYAVVVDGDTLRYVLDDSLKDRFLDLTTRCETVVCCRVSPSQKAATVRMVKEGRNAMTLSIGDGANDVAMIQEANVGCGLFGLEGSQAAMSADYAFAQFRFLSKLLLVHGRWSYLRVADMHGNFFYKNMVWTFPMFWFLFSTGFDAVNVYHFTFLIFASILFTAAPVIILGATDQDVNAKASMAYPQLYERGIRGAEYTRTIFWMYMLDGLYQSIVVYFLPFICWNNFIPFLPNGHALDSVTELGTTVATAAVFAANIYIGLNTRYWSIVTWLSIILSNASMLIWVAGYSFAFSVDFYLEASSLFASVEFWANVALAVTLALAPRFFAKFFQQAYMPLDRDIVREMWVKGALKEQLGIPHRRTRRRQRTLAEIASTATGGSNDSTDQTLAHDLPPAEHHEMKPLSVHVTAPSIASLSAVNQDSDLRMRSPHSRASREYDDIELSGSSDRPLSAHIMARTGTDMSYYSASDIRDV
ncbi:phospholipid-translocating P-type ATPase [Auriculariales sp. MPI-PUGE-AT-0066]|nr:phospholipid-translocating P-type ATPase [Auriculariales sp. MPI-PUGE-AT-0066]